MLKKHKILLGSAVLVFANFAQAQTATMSDTAPTPSATPNTSAAPGAAAGQPAPGTTVVIVPVETTPAPSAANDPLIQRRIEKKQAKDDYKAKKKEAKQEYKAEKKEANANLKAAEQAGELRPTNGATTSSGN